MTGQLLMFRPARPARPVSRDLSRCDGNVEHLAWSLQAGLRIVGCLACRSTGRYAADLAHPESGPVGFFV